MPWLTGPALYLVFALLVTNMGAGFMWWVNSTQADHYKAKADTYKIERDNCHLKHDNFVRSTRAAGEKSLAEAKKVKEDNERNANETAKGWAAVVAVVRADAVKWMRAAADKGGSTGSGGAPDSAQIGQEVAGTHPDSIPSPARVAADCAETTLTANYLQQYIERLQ